MNYNNEIPLVSIDCITYNHASYIRDAIEGFLMQKTNFAFEVLIHDDASTDSTAAIIKEYEIKYPEIIKPIYQVENQYSKKDGTIGRIQRGRAKGKYYAICEGDDYWTDPYKLQKQVDFLEANPDYGMVHTAYQKYNEEVNKFERFKVHNILTGSIFEDLLKGENFIATLTVLVRTSILRDVSELIAIPKIANNWKMGDLPLWLGVSRVSKIGYISDTTAVYRLLNESASHSKDLYKCIDFCNSTLDVKRWFCNKFDKEEWIPVIEENYNYKLYLISIKLGSKKKYDYSVIVNENKLHYNKNFENYVLKFVSKSNIFELIFSVLYKCRTKFKYL